ncbi:MAG: hypothetical protein IJS96_00515 [Schwartzia sp.]|nr:hypothetical protein [Schwartzia sp. (in: firmicutes)]
MSNIEYDENGFRMEVVGKNMASIFSDFHAVTKRLMLISVAMIFKRTSATLTLTNKAVRRSGLRIYVAQG